MREVGGAVYLTISLVFTDLAFEAALANGAVV
jgi:hypothetical protein